MKYFKYLAFLVVLVGNTVAFGATDCTSPADNFNNLLNGLIFKILSH